MTKPFCTLVVARLTSSKNSETVSGLLGAREPRNFVPKKVLVFFYQWCPLNAKTIAKYQEQQANVDRLQVHMLAFCKEILSEF